MNFKKCIYTMADAASHYEHPLPFLTTAHVFVRDLSPYTALPSAVFLPASVVLQQDMISLAV